MVRHCVLFLGTGAITGIGRRTVGIPTALVLQIGGKIAQIGIVQRVFVRRHAGSAIADLVLDSVFGRGTAGKQLVSLEDAFQRRCALGELIMAEPAFVIENLAAAIRPALCRLLELVNRERALMGVS